MAGLKRNAELVGNLFPSVVAAGLADDMGQLVILALGTDHQGRNVRFPVGPSVALFGVTHSFLGNWHDFYLENCRLWSV